MCNRILSLRTFVFSGLFVLLCSCGPVYRTNYTFLPPENAQGKACVFQCQNGNLQCRQLQDAAQRRCRDRAELDYSYCQNRNIGKHKDDQEYCYRAYCSSSDYAPCDSSYRSCYQTCGGTVTSETVCVSNCEQAT